MSLSGYVVPNTGNNFEVRVITSEPFGNNVSSGDLRIWVTSADV